MLSSPGGREPSTTLVYPSGMVWSQEAEVQKTWLEQQPWHRRLSFKPRHYTAAFFHAISSKDLHVGEIELHLGYLGVSLGKAHLPPGSAGCSSHQIQRDALSHHPDTPLSSTPTFEKRWRSLVTPYSAITPLLLGF